MSRSSATLYQRLVAFHRLPPAALLTTIITSAGAVFITRSLDWPVWVVVTAALLPWVPRFVRDLACTSQRDRWLGLAYLLVLAQGGHTAEHVIQMVQIHFLRLTGAAARGLIGQLDLEWVHFTFNSIILIGVLLLLLARRHNPWLWLTVLLAGWHQLEHLLMIVVYVTTGVAGSPGLLARGGLIGGGLPLTRPDLHFLYNLIETMPLVLAFIQMLREAATCGLAQRTIIDH